jgi:hypothetical protein
MTIIDEIAAERRRQIEAEGWSPEHDDDHLSGDLAVAGACYAMEGANMGDMYPRTNGVPDLWPWTDDTWKPKDTRRNLVRAAALIVAELERMDRFAPSKDTNQ